MATRRERLQITLVVLGVLLFVLYLATRSRSVDHSQYASRRMAQPLHAGPGTLDLEADTAAQ